MPESGLGAAAVVTQADLEGLPVDILLSCYRFRRNARFRYVCDMICTWEQEFRVEERLFAAVGKHYPVCIYGGGACPPEDFGGPDARDQGQRACRRSSLALSGCVNEIEGAEQLGRDGDLAPALGAALPVPDRGGLEVDVLETDGQGFGDAGTGVGEREGEGLVKGTSS